MFQKVVLGHKNPIQAHGRGRLFLLSSTMAKIHPNCPCKTKPQMETSKTLGSGMALHAIKIQLNNVESLEIIQES